MGDLVYYGPGGGTHVELVVGVSGRSIQTIGGNTSGSLDGKAFFNGDGVYQKTVQRTSRIFGYGHPEFSSGAAPSGGGGGAPAQAKGPVKPITSIRSIRQQQDAVNGLGHKPPLDADGEWGPKTEAGVKWLQKKVGVGRRRRVGERNGAALHGFLEITDVRGRRRGGPVLAYARAAW